MYRSKSFNTYEISIHVPYERGRPYRCSCVRFSCAFQSTSPTRGDDITDGFLGVKSKQFQSTSPTRGDDSRRCRMERATRYFNPRPLREGTTVHAVGGGGGFVDFNPRPLREGTTRCLLASELEAIDFNPRPLREGTTFLHAASSSSPFEFQSTSPTRGDDMLKGGA